MAEKKVTLSVAIAVFNEEKNLESCLASVADIADEIVVVDGCSTDRTVSIAKKFTTKIIQTDNPAIFHINKQKALDACTGDWILQLDADEIIPENLKEEIKEVVEDKGNKTAGYYIPRKNYFWGHWMRKGGQYPDPVIRLVRRGKARFPSKTVHEQIEVDGKVAYLKNPMNHMSYKTREDYWRKADAYTTLAAMEMKRNGVAKNAWTWFTYNIWKPKMTFLSLFIRHRGFEDGWYGFVFALWSAMHFPIAYKKFTKLLLVILFFLITVTPARADYVLPYPSFMPGNKLYKITRILDRLESYWYFGNIAQFTYHLKLSDKYLVEAKTLMEYKQYLLAVDALTRSDGEFSQLPARLGAVKNEGADVTAFTQTVEDAAVKHKEVLSGLRIPEHFVWKPEKAASTNLELGSMIQSSIAIRETVASAAAGL